ncbi:MAG: hypothetical protein LC648_02145 [Novosphingobium sp.]|nr:hypothetical protein [Novosphingobium sp.]
MSSRKRAAPLANPALAHRKPAVPRSPAGAANDNGSDPHDDALLGAALRLFAEHGLGAAHRAQAQAEEAFFAGERERYRWWLAVTRALDRQLAVDLCGRMGSDLFGSQSLPAR